MSKQSLEWSFCRMGSRLILLVIAQMLLTGSVNGQPLLSWSEWTPVKELPAGIELFRGAGSIGGDTVTAYYTSTNLQSGKFVFYPLYSEMNQKPLSFYEENREDVLIITNGGYFGTNVSYSMVHNNFHTHAPNIRAVNRTYNNQSYAYFPTRGAFGIPPSQYASAEYIYTLPDGVTYHYPRPSQNSTDAPPLPPPDSEFPEGGNPWNVSEAIGGGPLLIKDGQAVEDYTPELFPPDITASIAPRTAIGIRADGRLINLVVDGRQDHSRGVSLEVLTDIMLDLGCVEAINLDGGGSSCLLVHEQVINQPSDGSTRYIPSVVAVKQATLHCLSDRAFFQPDTQPIDSLEYDYYGFNKWYLFAPGEIGTCFIGPGNPAEYRIEIPVREHSSALSDSLQLVLHRQTGLRDTLYLDQGNTATDYFYTLGSYQLGPGDSITVHNLDPDTDALLPGFRLIRTNSGQPLVSLLNRESFGKHSLYETIRFVTEASGRNIYRQIERFKLYEEKEGGRELLIDRSFEPADQSRDTVLYTLESLHDPILLHFTYFDTYGDSVPVTYTIQQDLSPPTVGFGKNSVLTGTPGDTLLFELKVKPGHPTRSLTSLLVSLNPESGNQVLATYTPNPSGDTIMFTYPLSMDDIPGVHFRFVAEDTAGFTGVRDYSLEVTGVAAIPAGSLKLDYMKNAHSLRFQSTAGDIRDVIRLQVIDLYGRVLLTAMCKPDQPVKLPRVEPGIYIVRYLYGQQAGSESFFLYEPGASSLLH